MMRQSGRAPWISMRTIALSLTLLAGAIPGPASAQAAPAASAPARATYADLVALAEASAVVAEVAVKDQAIVPPERAPGLAAGRVRLYLQTQTQRVLKGPSALGESVSYLADVAPGAKGKPPKLKKQTFLVFANPVAGRPGELQLVAPDAQLALYPPTEDRGRTVSGQLVEPDAATRGTRVHVVITVAGNLAGE